MISLKCSRAHAGVPYMFHTDSAQAGQTASSYMYGRLKGTTKPYGISSARQCFLMALLCHVERPAIYMAHAENIPLSLAPGIPAHHPCREPLVFRAERPKSVQSALVRSEHVTLLPPSPG